MPIKKKSCRITERQRMRALHQAGYALPQISNAMSIDAALIERVLSGQWAAEEEDAAALGIIAGKQRAEAKAISEKERIAEVAAAAAAAVADIKPQAKTRQRRKQPERGSGPVPAPVPGTAEYAEA